MMPTEKWLNYKAKPIGTTGRPLSLESRFTASSARVPLYLKPQAGRHAIAQGEVERSVTEPWVGTDSGSTSPNGAQPLENKIGSTIKAEFRPFGAGAVFILIF